MHSNHTPSSAFSSRPAGPPVSALSTVTTQVLCSGVVLLSLTVVLAVWGAGWSWPGARQNPTAWTAGSLLLGGLLLLLVQAFFLRRLHPWAAARAWPDPAATLVGVDPIGPAKQPAGKDYSLRERPLDPLTGLLGAEAFELRLHVWQQARAGASMRPASLLLIDLDRFKQINEIAGREAGDALLRQAAQVLLTHVREGDAVARLEDDSFALLLPGCLPEQALHLGKRLQTALAELGVEHAGRRLGVGATVGVAARRAREGGSVADWLSHARAAWYEAKYGGSGGVRLAAPVACVGLVTPA